MSYPQTANDVVIQRVSGPYGWLGNMSPHPVYYKGLTYRTVEALFQCLRWNPKSLAHSTIRMEMSPMGAKMRAKYFLKNHPEWLEVEPRSTEDVINMEKCLRIKIRQWPELEQGLRDTKNRTIVEDCGKRPTESGLFWGARGYMGNWEGDNTLGELWMDIRSSRRALWTLGRWAQKLSGEE